MGSSCVKKILGLDDDTGKAKEIAKKNNIRLFEKGVYIDITNLSQYVLDVLCDYMRHTSIQEILKWMDMYKTNPIMLAVIQSVYEEKHRQELRRQKEAAEKEAQRLLSEKHRQKEASELENNVKIQNELNLKRVAEQEEQMRLNVQREAEEEIEKQLDSLLWIEFLELKRKRMDDPDIVKRKIYDQERREQMEKDDTCQCLLKNSEICRCSAPRFKLSHIPPYEDCLLCYKYKCRC
jgi:hypothetical protein